MFRNLNTIFKIALFAVIILSINSCKKNQNQIEPVAKHKYNLVPITQSNQNTVSINTESDAPPTIKSISMCGSYNWNIVANASVANFAHVGFLLVDLDTGAPVIQIDIPMACVTIANVFNNGVASQTLNTAFNATMQDLAVLLSSDAIPINQVALTTFLLSSMNNDLSILKPGSIISGNPCSGNVITQQPVYCN